MRYEQMSFEQRYTIECMLRQGHKKKHIAEAIGVCEPSLYRALKRNSPPRGRYRAKHAQMLADERKREGRTKKRFTPAVRKYAMDKLEKYQ